MKTAIYKTPHELLSESKNLENCGWTEYKIGLFFICGLLIGKRKKRKIYILESSFDELVEYSGTVYLKRQKYKMHEKLHDVLTPKEIGDKYSLILEQLSWNPIRIGIFYSADLLSGYKSAKEDKTLIIEESLFDLINYVNKVQANKRIDIQSLRDKK
jgi:hypothetical protein